MTHVPDTLLEGQHTHAGQYVQVEAVDLIHNQRRTVVVTVDRTTLELDVECDALFMEHFAEAILAELLTQRLRARLAAKGAA